MAVALLATRLVLATVLGVAGVAKLIDRQGTRRALLDFGVPARLARPAALVLPLIELATAAALVPSVSGRWGALAALALLSAFSVAIGAALLRGRRPNCHCFGRLHSAPAGWPTLVRNSGLAALAGAVVWLDPTTSALTRREHIVVLGAFAAALVLAAQAWIWFQLLRQNGRILVRLQQIERVSQGTSEPVALLGSTAPAFDLATSAGGRLSLAGLLARGRPVLLVFSHASCGPCLELLPRLARWQDERAGQLTIAVVSEGTTEVSSPVRNAAMQVEREVAEAYGVTATPAALLIDRNGVIASVVALGAEAIEALVPEPAPHPDEVAHRRNVGLALGLTAGAAALATSAAAAAAATAPRLEQAVVDPELLGLRVSIKLANPRLVADSRDVQRALLALSRAKQKRPAQAAVQAALRRESKHLRQLGRVLQGVPTSGEHAVEAKRLATRSLSLLAEGLDRFGRAVVSPHASDSSRLLKQAQIPLAQARSLAYAANVLLGCTGKGC